MVQCRRLDVLPGTVQHNWSHRHSLESMSFVSTDCLPQLQSSTPGMGTAQEKCAQQCTVASTCNVGIRGAIRASPPPEVPAKDAVLLRLSSMYPSCPGCCWAPASERSATSPVTSATRIAADRLTGSAHISSVTSQCFQCRYLQHCVADTAPVRRSCSTTAPACATTRNAEADACSCCSSAKAAVSGCSHSCKTGMQGNSQPGNVTQSSSSSE